MWAIRLSNKVDKAQSLHYLFMKQNIEISLVQKKLNVGTSNFTIELSIAYLVACRSN